VTPADFAGSLVTLPPGDAHHARNVLRLRIGEAIILLDGTGLAHEATLTDVSPAGVAAEVTASAPSASEPRTRITVAQALPKNPDKLEEVLQHGTEVGAADFVVFGAQRSVAKMDDSKTSKRQERWNGIVKGAAEQSGRGILPTVRWAGNGIKNLPPLIGDTLAFILHESASLLLSEVLKETPDTAANFLIAVGPEGGFTPEEVAQFTTINGGRAISLGPRILRTETAALVALSQILFVRG
jgi:16S rRNA (uracil1498-N3)-methyltransferase